MNWEYYKQYIIGKETVRRCDISPIFENPEVFNNLIKDFSNFFNKDSFDKIVALDALGFLIGSGLALKLKKPLILVRKEGKLPYKKEKKNIDHFIDYTKTKKGFEMRKNSIQREDRILVVDEWIETGTQIKSAIKLIKKQGGRIIGIATLNMDLSKKTKGLFDKYSCKAIRIANHLK